MLTGVKKIVSRQQLESEASHRPTVRPIIPLAADDDFRTSVLPRLDVVGEVVVDIACVSEIRNLDLDLYPS